MIDESDRRQLEEISFVLADRSKPTLVCIAVGSYRKRLELRDELDSALPDYRSATLDLSGVQITSLYRAIKERAPREVLDSRPVEYLLHIFGIEDSLLVSHGGELAASSLIAELNLERENLFHEFPCCLILWTTPHFIDKLRQDAPDLLDWVTYLYRFHDDQGDLLPEESPEPLASPPGVTSERSRQISEMEERLARLKLDNDAPERVIRAKLGLYKALGTEYLGAFRSEDSVRCYTAVLSLLQQTAHAVFEEAEIYFLLGTAYLQGRCFDQALSSCEASLRIQEKGDDHSNVGSTLHRIGRVYQGLRKWVQALESYRYALEWQDKTGQHHDLGGTWHQIGRVYEEQREWTKALENYRKALEWKEKTGQHHELGSTWHHVGLTYQKQGKWAQALENYRQALEWNEKTGELHKLGTTWHQIGRIYEEQGELPQALGSYWKALEWQEKTGQQHNLGITRHQSGRVYEKLGEFDEALDNYLTSFNLCAKAGMKPHCDLVRESIRRIFPRLSVEAKERLKSVLPEEVSEEPEGEGYKS